MPRKNSGWTQLNSNLGAPGAEGCGCGASPGVVETANIRATNRDTELSESGRTRRNLGHLNKPELSEPNGPGPIAPRRSPVRVRLLHSTAGLLAGHSEVSIS